MKWEVVKLPANHKSRGIPFASVGYSRLSINAAACELIENHQSVQYVELLKGKTNNNLCIGVRFLTEATANTLKVSRKKDANGKYLTGFDITNKHIIESLFGPAGSARKATRYAVKKDPETDNILIITAE